MAASARRLYGAFIGLPSIASTHRLVNRACDDEPPAPGGSSGATEPALIDQHRSNGGLRWYPA